MFAFVHYLLYFIAMVSAALSVHYSIRTRREAEGKARGLYGAKLNIAMGVMLISFAAVQLFLYGFDSWVRVGVGFVFLLIGLFNLLAGMRSYAHYR